MIRFLILLIIILVPLPVYALQATINLPNSEVLDENDILLKDVTSFYSKTNIGNTSPNITYGIGHLSEISIGVPIITDFNDSPIVKTSIEGKKVFTIVDKNNRLTVGGGISPYLNKSICPEGFIFAHGTRKIEKTNTSISLGGYIAGDKTLFNNGGFLAILDQKIYKDVSVLSEYTTGNGSRSNFSVGLRYKIKDVSITNSIILPNHHNNVGFQITVAKLIRR